MCSENEKIFFQCIGKQIMSMLKLIEERLAVVEPLRKAAFSRMFSIAKATFNKTDGQIEFKMFGSMETKLAIDTSDMDISLYGVIDQATLSSSENPRQDIVEAMEKIHRRFDALDWVENNNLIDKASVPVIKLVINLEKLEKLEMEEAEEGDKPKSIFEDREEDKEE